MAKYFFGSAETGYVEEASFEQLISLLKGHSIVSLADWGGDRLELGLSGNLMVRLTVTDSALALNILIHRKSRRTGGCLTCTWRDAAAS